MTLVMLIIVPKKKFFNKFSKCYTMLSKCTKRHFYTFFAFPAIFLKIAL